MGKSMILGVASGFLIIFLLLSGLIVSSIITDKTTEIPINQDYIQITDEIINKTSTYIQIQEQKGKYNEINGERKIDKIILYISPLISQKIDISQLRIQINNGETIRFLKYSENVEDLDSYSVFDHPVWENMDGTNFGFISVIDLDDSLLNNNLLNDYSDHVYIVFRLSNDMALAKNEQLTVTLLPSPGITRTTILKAPFSIKPIVDL